MTATAGFHEPRVGGLVAELTGPGEVVLEERPVPAASPGESVVRIRATGLCGTDLHAFRGRADQYPITIGHDAVGVVLESDLLVPGTRVTIDPSIWCGRCGYCAQQLYQLCERGGYLGMQYPGTMAEYICVPSRNLVALPRAVTDAEATVLEPIAVALHTLERIGTFAPEGMHADVIGGGPLGVLLAQSLTAYGWYVTIYEPSEQRRQVGVAAGMDVRDVNDLIPSRHSPILVVETSAHPSGVELAQRLVSPGSYLAVVGRAHATLSIADVLNNELSVVGIRAGVGCYRASADLVATGQVRPGSVITHTVPFAEVEEALQISSAENTPVMRCIVQMRA